ncbi:hypothetical protein HHX47_DHR8000424 [Lentinula edodes]|nr:hypothetical protein HHX47_DHR8000424 [Lentinula edodes]
MWWSLPPPTTTLPGQPGGATPNEIISNTGPGPGGRGASETPGGAGAGSVEAGNFLLKFEDFQFDASYHDKYITLESIMGPRSIENPKEYLPPSVTMGTGTPTSANTSTSTTPRLRNAQVRNGAPAAVGVTGLSGPSSSATSSTTMSTSSSPAINGITGSTTAFSSSPTMMNWESEQSAHPSASSGRSQWDEPRVLISQGFIPGEPVNAFGIPQATMRCLELAESVAQMSDLIVFSKEEGLGPLDALSKMAGKIRQWMPLPQQPFINGVSGSGPNFSNANNPSNSNNLNNNHSSPSSSSGTYRFSGPGSGSGLFFFSGPGPNPMSSINGVGSPPMSTTALYSSAPPFVTNPSNLANPTSSSVFLPASDIPSFVGKGNVDLGITGHDVILESQMHEHVTEELRLGFGKCALQVQVPEAGSVKIVEDLVDKRVVTSFEVLSGEYLINWTTFFNSQIDYVGGSVEAACALGLADGIREFLAEVPQKIRLEKDVCSLYNGVREYTDKNQFDITITNRSSAHIHTPILVIALT